MIHLRRGNGGHSAELPLEAYRGPERDALAEVRGLGDVSFERDPA